MTRHVRSFKNVAAGAATWRELSSPPAANDIARTAIPLSRSLPKDGRERALLRATLDVARPSDLRAAALLAMLGLGLHKRDVVQLNVGDLVLEGAAVGVTVRERNGNGRVAFLPLIAEEARVLRDYLAAQHDERASLDSPLFCSIEHGQVDQLKRITSNAISYWLLELRLRARQALANRGLTPRVPGAPRRKAARGARGSRR